MRNVPLELMGTMLRLPLPWLAWLGLLMLVNMGAPLFLLPHPEAWATLAAFAASFVTLTAIFSRWGFVRLLGLGHLPWLPLVIWLGTRLAAFEPGTAMRYWMLSVIVLNTVSLAIDAVDTVRYLRGERAPTIAPKP